MKWNGNGLRLDTPDGYSTKSLRFAEEFIAQNNHLYLARGGTHLRLSSQLHLGKLAEYAVAYYLSANKHYPWCEPDCSILPVSNKSYDADLVYTPTIKVHVKSCEQSNLPESYLFQVNDPILHTNSNDLIALVYIIAGVCYLRCLDRCSKIMKLARDPLAHRFLGQKKAIYASDL